MENNKNRKIASIDDLCKNLKFENETENFNVNNGKDLLNYINKINEKVFNLEESISKNIKEDEEKKVKKFIPLFESNNYFLFYESINDTIKISIEPPNEININNNYNNVFILNKILEQNKELCFEIKLGHGLWDNNLVTKDLDISDKYNIMNSFKIGLLKLNEEKIKNMSDYLTISPEKKINSKVVWGSIFSSFTQKSFDNLCKKYDSYKNNIFYCADLNHLFISIEKKIKQNEKIKVNRLIQKNDIIGVVINNKKIKEYIEVRIYINGILVKSELIPKEDNCDDNFSDIDDDYIIEKEKTLKYFSLIPFIELGINKSIFIKDKPNCNKNKEIISNEKMEYFEIYNCLPLNDFCEKTLEIQKITDLYLDVLIKVGSKIFNLFPKEKEIDIYFKQLINFFNKYIFNNKVVIKNKIMDFLSNGINLENGDIIQFKENIKTLFYIIDKYERKIDEKIELTKLIINLLIELINENNFNLLNDYNLNEDNKDEINQIVILRKNRFLLFFLLFDNYIREEKVINKYFNQESFFKEERDFINFCFAMFYSFFYKDSSNSIDFLKSFYNQENKFLINKFLEYNFNKSIIQYNQNYKSILREEIIQDYKSIIQNIKENIIYKKNKQTELLFKFMSIFAKAEDDVSIINIIIIQLIKNYFESNTPQLDKTQLNKLIYIHYMNFSKNFNTTNNEDTFFGKYDLSEIKQKLYSLSENDIKEDKIKDAYIFDLIVNCISNYYEKFLIKEKNAKNSIEFLYKNNNNLNYLNYQINKINHMIEFYQVIFSGNFYLNILVYGKYLIDVIVLSLKNNYLNILPYKIYLQNILFILKYFKLRCSFIAKDNLLDTSEPQIISSIVENIFKYTTEFLGKYFSKINCNKFSSKEKYEEIIFLHLKILKEVFMFDIGAIKHALNEVKENLNLIFKNLLEIYDEQKYKKLYININSFIEFIYYNNNKEYINGEIKKIFFKDIMEKEIKEFSKMKNETETKKNNFIEKTMYFNIFMIIYKRIKIIRDSLKEIMAKKELFLQELFYEKKYIIKFTKIINILFNFLKDNKLNIFYDVRCIPFLKINSFICKTFKILYDSQTFMKFQKIYEENNKLILNFFTQFFFLISKILLSQEEQFDYNYRISKNRKGFYFNEFKKNFEIYFGYPNCKMMIDFLDILSNSFKNICDDKDTLNEKDVDDNSIDIDQRDSCPICLDFTDEKDVHLKDCNHIYHLECLKLQIKKNLTNCSLCKRPITGIKEDPNFKVNSISNTNIRSNLFGNFNNPFLNSNNHNFFISNENRNRNRSPNRINSNNSLFGINSLFGEVVSSNNSLFGTSNNTNSIFGTSNNNNSLFSTSNNNYRNNNSNNSLFGTSNNTNSLFGTSNNNYRNNISLFGTSNNNNSLFGTSNNNNSLFGRSNNNSLFGNTDNNNSGTGLFGNTNNNNSQSRFGNEGSLFRNTNNNNSSTGTGLFG